MSKSSVAQRIRELSEIMDDISKITDKYLDNPELSNRPSARQDTVKVASLLIYLNTWVGEFDAEVLNLEDERKRKLSQSVAIELDSDGKTAVGAAEHRARAGLTELDKAISRVRSASYRCRNFMFAAQRWIDQVNISIKTTMYEMRTVQNDLAES